MPRAAVRAPLPRSLLLGGLAMGALVTAACGASQRESVGPIESVAPALDPALDDGAQLATLLPSQGERCTVARPSLVADRRRPLIHRASQGDALAWAREPRIVAYAASRAVGARGRVHTVTLIRLASSYAGRRDALEGELPLRIRWEDERCRADTCDLPRASMLDDRTLRIERGDEEPDDAPRGGSPCVDLAVAWPSAIELEVSAQRCDHSGSETCARRRILEAEEDGLRQRTEDSLESEAAAVRALEALRHVPELEGGIDLDRRGATMVTSRRVSWAELEILLEDERLERAAYARRAESRRERPVDEIDITRLPLVRAQARVREERLVRLHGEGRRAAADELASLLLRATQIHPQALDLARRLARLQLDEQGDVDGALRTIDAALATGLAPREVWQPLRREARIAQLAASDPSLATDPRASAALEGAASALLDAGLAPDVDTARAAALDLAALRNAGAPHELAESAWSHAHAIVARAIPMRAMRAGAGAPLASLPATLAWMTELAGDAGPFSVFVVARGAIGEGARDVSAAEAPEDTVLLRLDRVADAPALAGSAASAEALARLGALLEASLAPGRVTFDVVLTSLSAPGVDRTLRLEAELGIGRLRLVRADAWTARHDWSAIERYLAEPLATLGARLFPASELAVRATSEEEAVHLARVGDDPPQARCVAEGVLVRCAPRADSDARGSLRRIVRAMLGGPAITTEAVEPAE